MQAAFLIRTLARRGLLSPGRPDRVARQLNALRRWGFTLTGEMRSAAARDPRRVAVIDETRSVTYGELAMNARRLANGLRAGYGLAEGDRLGLLCRNSVSMFESMLAAGMIGADVVLVNTGLGPGQLENVLHNQQVSVLIHDDEFFEMVSAVPPSVARVSADGDAGRETPTVAGLIERSPDDDGPPPEQTGRTIVLTSGTTGTPKGARRPIPPSFSPLAAVISRIPMSVGERIFIAAPLFHTWGYAGLQIALALRATVVLRRRFEPMDTLAAIHEHQCTALLAVPVMLQRMLDASQGRRIHTPLRVVATSGSAMPAPVVLRFMDVFGDVLYNLYGSTEASWASIATPDELRADPTCAGRSPVGTKVLILDPNGNPLPPQKVGRIFVGNDMLFEGYTDGGNKEWRNGLIATGDIGRVSPEGLVYVDGREDDMVICGGENVYPSAVENAIAELPQVRDVAVVGVPDRVYGQRLAAWIVLYQGEQLDSEGVREYVRRTAARFSVPRDVHFVAELPRNATGKIMRRYLAPSAPTSPAPAGPAQAGPAPMRQAPTHQPPTHQPPTSPRSSYRAPMSPPPRQPDPRSAADSNDVTMHLPRIED
ncbi:AMP-binding protein [Planosporangium mesophilum]|uniref:Fatty-acyl-CoA synthase n=1 Tax=Planosporangium mesophilum TaxID=689768 RepID=A0A8J3X2Y6_9ACTN|nr:AMP-binding protein [Planosporangium mesophilum]NJC82300.1 AMP-binding protein [Planosporangium mesophilum]GII22353.1 fatty-acyl-CoA synthase [Planosporangium mesophilum]